MFATSVKCKSSVISLCDVNIANELKLFCFMVARSHVFTLRIIENEHSAVAVVGATTSKSLTIFSTEGIISQLSRLHCFSTSMISNVCEDLFFLQMLFKTSSSVLSYVTSTSSPKIFFISSISSLASSPSIPLRTTYSIVQNALKLSCSKRDIRAFERWSQLLQNTKVDNSLQLLLGGDFQLIDALPHKLELNSLADFVSLAK